MNVFSRKKPLRLYICRHGQTDYNLSNILQGGGIDSDLNATGLEQGRKFYDAYKNVPFWGMYATNLKRSQQTLEPFRDLAYDVGQLDEFAEMHWGEYEGRPIEGELETQLKSAIHKWTQGETDFAPPGAEAPEVVLRRVEKGFRYITSLHDSGNILICTHGRTIRIILCHLLGYDLKHMQLFDHHNTCMNILVKTGSRYYAETLNDYRHLAN